MLKNNSIRIVSYSEDYSIFSLGFCDKPSQGSVSLLYQGESFKMPTPYLPTVISVVTCESSYDEGFSTSGSFNPTVPLRSRRIIKLKTLTCIVTLHQWRDVSVFFCCDNGRILVRVQCDHNRQSSEWHLVPEALFSAHQSTPAFWLPSSSTVGNPFCGK